MKNKLTFNEKKHEYKLGKKKLTSVTKFISQFFEPFDAKAIARNISNGFKSRNYQKFKAHIPIPDIDKKKATMKYWLAEWKEGAEHGTRVHKHLEDFVTKKNTGVYGEDKRDFLKTGYGIEWLDNNVTPEGFHKLIAEKIIYDEELELAGTIDLIAGTMLVDWKTNAKLNDEKMEKYTLQLSMYRYMLERQGVKVTKLILVHLKEDKYEEIEVDYAKDKIENMLREKGRLE